MSRAHPASGGIARSALQHASMLARCGVAVTVLGLYSTSLPIGTDDLDVPGCIVRAYACDPDDAAPADLLDDLRAVLENAALVQLNGHRSPLNFELAALCQAAHVPYIVSSRCELSISEQLAGSAAAEALETPSQAAYVAGAWGLHMTSAFEVRRAALAPEGGPPVLLIPNVVELDPAWLEISRVVARRDLGIAPDDTLLLYFGRIVAEKNPGWLLHVLAELDDSERLDYVGPVTDVVRDQILDEARRLGVADRVKFHGFAGGANRARWLRAADVFLLPSYGENFCLALVEAVACGTAALSTPFVGALEFLSSRDVVVEDLDAVRWAQRCHELAARGPATLTRLPELAERFGPEAIAVPWMAIVGDLVCDSRPRDAARG